MDVNTGLDDPESPDATPADGDFDLTPRTGSAAPRGGTGPRRYLGIAALVVLLAGLGFVLFKGLSDAATFFYNVDEAVERREQLGGDRFRMQGNVVYGSVDATADGVDFVISFNDVEVPVRHTGTPPELFGPEIPVVIEGTFEGEGFASDEILVKHDNVYSEENTDRIDEAEADVARERSGGGGERAPTEGG